jgi:hypothetical protein
LGGEDRDDEARAPHAGGLPEGRHDAATLAWWTLIAHVDDAVVHERARRARRDPRAALRGPPGFRFDIVEWVAQAFERPHPGARERALDELRWRLADELAVAHPGTFGALVAHARAAAPRLALGALERRGGRERARSRAAADRGISCLTSVASSRSPDRWSRRPSTSQ